MNVRVERDGPVTTVILDRPAVRNAVDGPTAAALTGRPVAAPEALAMGLADRVVPLGQARSAAEALAREIAALPQQCLRSDRASTLEGGWLGEGEAMANEFRRGMAVLAGPGIAAGGKPTSGGVVRPPPTPQANARMIGPLLHPS